MGRCCCMELRLHETDFFCISGLLSGFISQESNHISRFFFMEVINTPEYCLKTQENLWVIVSETKKPE